MGVAAALGERTMKRDWDVIREVLIEVESLNADERDRFAYCVRSDRDSTKDAHALLLRKAGLLEGADAESMGEAALLCPALTWQGHELLDTLRSKPVWQRIKSTAKDKGVELTFDTVKALGKMALDYVLRNGP
jgi:hypothetical protein